MLITTDIPPFITTPDTVESQIGTLNFFDGFADKAAVEVAHGEAGMMAVVEVATP